MELNRRYLLRLYLEQKNIIRVLKQWNFLFLTSPYSVSLTLAMPGLAYKSQYTVMRISFFLSKQSDITFSWKEWSDLNGMKPDPWIFQTSLVCILSSCFSIMRFLKTYLILWNEISMSKGTSMSQIHQVHT